MTMRLSPFDPQAFVTHLVIGFAHFIASRYDEAATWAEKALLEQTSPARRAVRQQAEPFWGELSEPKWPWRACAKLIHHYALRTSRMLLHFAAQKAWPGMRTV
jgi:adenylate cyclase